MCIRDSKETVLYARTLATRFQWKSNELQRFVLIVNREIVWRSVSLHFDTAKKSLMTMSNDKRVSPFIRYRIKALTIFHPDVFSDASSKPFSLNCSFLSSFINRYEKNRVISLSHSTQYQSLLRSVTLMHFFMCVTSLDAYVQRQGFYKAWAAYNDFSIWVDQHYLFNSSQQEELEEGKWTKTILHVDSCFPPHHRWFEQP